MKRPSTRGLIERWREHLPVSAATPIVTLGEGDTPLVRAPALEDEIGGDHAIYVKFEGANPTGSFKDRGMTVALSKAMEEGSRGVICASTGNTSAAAAAYAGRAGIPCWVVLPAGKVALGKLAQAVVHGAQVVPVTGNFDAALELVRTVAREESLTLVNSVNPYRIEGQKTLAFEIVEAFGGAPTAHFLPVGNAGNITATWRGYREIVPNAEERPRLFGYQAAGAAPIVAGHPIENPETIATAIRIGNPASWEGAVNAATESGGAIAAVTDDEILSAYHLLASRVGIFCEPASAASVAGLRQRHARGELDLPAGSTIVCTLTGHGLKDPDRATHGVTVDDPIEPTLDAFRTRLESNA